jgi:peptidoglycan/xylan/chitin deacetylase (PgdA/CDA1 family)
MNDNLWSSNRPARFWLPHPAIQQEHWRNAIQKALPILGLSVQPADEDQILTAVLGEGQFGPGHWQLNIYKRTYYLVKPLIPRTLTRKLRQFLSSHSQSIYSLGWPIEDRYVRFQWEVLRQLMLSLGQTAISYTRLWPAGHGYAFVLTHDVETKKGQEYVRRVADLEEDYGFRSSFNFIPERYKLDQGLIDDLRARGFEIGIHGLKHDGGLFRSYAEFKRRATKINAYLKELGAVGFRSPLTLRNPHWMQELEIEYDLSFFDTDPYEPIPGGTMSIWPFFLGRFVELPYTLVQDFTLFAVLGERTPKIWLRKVDFIQKYHGMVLVNTHPDYLFNSFTWKIYSEFLQSMKNRSGYWHALPMDTARWWYNRRNAINSNLTTYKLSAEAGLLPGSILGS